MSDDDLVLTAREWCPLCPEPIELGAYGMTEMERERAVVVHIRDAHPNSRAATLARDALIPSFDYADAFMEWMRREIRVEYQEHVTRLFREMVAPVPAPVRFTHFALPERDDVVRTPSLEHEPDDSVDVPWTRSGFLQRQAAIHPEWARPVLTSSSHVRPHVFVEDYCIRCGLPCDATEPCR